MDLCHHIVLSFSGLFGFILYLIIISLHVRLHSNKREERMWIWVGGEVERASYRMRSCYAFLVMMDYVLTDYESKYILVHLNCFLTGIWPQK